MENSDLRAQLHQMINAADEEKIEKIFSICSSLEGMERYSDPDISEFYRRLTLYNEGQLMMASVEDAHSFVRNKLERK